MGSFGAFIVAVIVIALVAYLLGKKSQQAKEGKALHEQSREAIETRDEVAELDDTQLSDAIDNELYDDDK